MASHRKNLRAKDILEGDSSEATAAAVAKNGAVIEEEFVDLDEFEFDNKDDFSVDKFVNSSGDIEGRFRLHGDIHDNWPSINSRTDTKNESRLFHQLFVFVTDFVLNSSSSFPLLFIEKF